MEKAISDVTGASLIFTLILALFTLWLAKRAGYFKLPPKSGSSVTFTQVFFVFLFYLILALLVLPFLFAIISFPFREQNAIPPDWISWGTIFYQLALFLFLLSFCFLIKRETAKEIFWGNSTNHKKTFFKGIALGAASWLISYPVVLFANAATGFISTWIWGKEDVEQVAVQHLKQTLGHSFLFVMMALGVVVLVPFMEELLFRGFLQSYLRRYLGRGGAIVLTGALFSLVHYAESQRAGNFQLIISLFFLSLFLGFVYERERTLWAPIAFHAFFNLSGVILIFFST